MKGKIIGAAVAAAVLMVGYFMLIRALRAETPELVKTIPSPDGAYTAYIHRAEKKVTKLNRYGLTVLPSGEQFSYQTNVYDCWMDFDVSWSGDNVLFVNNSASIDKVQNTRLDGLRISYAYLKNPVQPEFHRVRFLSAEPSPGGGRIAYRYQTEPTGKGEPAIYMLVIESSQENFVYASGREVYVAYTDFSMSWVDDNTLRVDNSPEEILYQVEQQNSIRIEYAHWARQ